MQTQLTNMVKKSPGNPFVRVKPGVFGLLRYPEAAPEPEVEAPKVETPKVEAPKVTAPKVTAPKATASEEKEDDTAESADGRRGRRRRGGRGRRRPERGSVEETTTEEKPAEVQASARSESPTAESSSTEDSDEAEEPSVGSLSAEDRAAALAESGVLEGASEDEDDDEAEEGGGDEEAHVSENAGADSAAKGQDSSLDKQGFDQDFSASNSQDPNTETTSSESARPAMPSSEQGSSHRPGEHRHEPSGPRKVMTPIDAAIEVLRGQAPGRGMHVRQIADSAIRRRLIHGEPNEAWRVMRSALSTESKERLRAGVRPRIKPAGSGLFALARRPPDSDLEKAEFVFGEYRKALRERTLAALEQRLGELTPAAFEAVVRVLLQREGFGPATFVKRVEGTVYVEALRGRGFRPSRCLIGLRSGMAAAGRRAVGELRAGIRARSQDEGLIILAGRLADDAITEWKQPGPPIEVVDGPALAETCIRHGLGVISAHITVELVDADFFAELVEG